MVETNKSTIFRHALRPFIRGVYYCGRILRNAFSHYIAESSWAFASHITLSSLMALFPFLIFATTLAGFFGTRAYTQTSIRWFLEVLPDALVQPISREIINVLTVPRRGLLTVSAIAAAYFATSGVESLRTALNRAYRVRDRRNFFFCRFQSLFFVLLGTLGLMAISLLLVLAPLIINIAQKDFPALAPYIGTIRFWRYAIAVVILLICLVAAHKWLPAGRRRYIDILPGIVVTFVIWLVASMLFAQYLASFANYSSTYAGLASLMVAIIFLYLLAQIFIFGGQINAAIMHLRQPGQK